MKQLNQYNPNNFGAHKIGGELLREVKRKGIGDENTHPFEAMIELKTMLYSIYEAAEKSHIYPHNFMRDLKKTGDFCKIGRSLYVTEKDIEKVKKIRSMYEKKYAND